MTRQEAVSMHRLLRSALPYAYAICAIVGLVMAIWEWLAE